MTSGTRKRLFNVLRLAICVAALWFVLKGVSLNDRVQLKDGTTIVGRVVSEGDPTTVTLPDGRQQTIPADHLARDADGAPDISYGLWTAWAKSRKSFLLLAVLLHLPVVLPQALRFRWLLKVQGIDMGYWECLKMTLAGNFLNFATPVGSHAGDVFKAYFVSLHTHQKTEAITTVVLDRIIGLTTLILIVTLITVLIPGDTRLALLRPYLLVMVGIGVVCVALYLSPFFRRSLRIKQILARLPMFGHVQRVDQTARTLAGSWRAVIAAMLLTAFLQSLAMSAYFSVAVALRLQHALDHVFEFLAYFYSGVVIQALPGPPQGLGTVELAYRYFFQPFGSPSQIVCMAFAIRVVVLIVSLPGLFVTATGAYRPRELRDFEAFAEGVGPDSAETGTQHGEPAAATGPP